MGLYYQQGCLASVHHLNPSSHANQVQSLDIVQSFTLTLCIKRSSCALRSLVQHGAAWPVLVRGLGNQFRTVLNWSN